MAELVVRTGPQAGHRVPVEGDVVLGRQGADLVLEDAEVSRRHAVVRQGDEGVEVEDLGSTNGTFVNGARIEGPTKLRGNDTVRVGQTKVEVAEDWRASETIASTGVHPRQGDVGESRPASGTGTREHDRPTQQLPSRPAQEEDAPASPARRWIMVAAGVAGLVIAVLIYNVLTGGVSKDDFVASANAICKAGDAKFKGDVSRGNGEDKQLQNEIGDARAVRIRTISAVRALERPDEPLRELDKFFSAFRVTTLSLSRLGEAVEGGSATTTSEARAKLGDAVDREAGLANAVGVRACGRLTLD